MFLPGAVNVGGLVFLGLGVLIHGPGPSRIWVTEVGNTAMNCLTMLYLLGSDFRAGRERAAAEQARRDREKAARRFLLKPGRYN